MTTCRCLNNFVVVARCLTKENLAIAHSRFGPGIAAFSFPGIREWKSPGMNPLVVINHCVVYYAAGVEWCSQRGWCVVYIHCLVHSCCISLCIISQAWQFELNRLKLSVICCKILFLLHTSLSFVVWTRLPETADRFSQQKEIFAVWQSWENPKIHQKCWLGIQDSPRGRFAKIFWWYIL